MNELASNMVCSGKQKQKSNNNNNNRKKLTFSCESIFNVPLADLLSVISCKVLVWELAEALFMNFGDCIVAEIVWIRVASVQQVVKCSVVAFIPTSHCFVNELTMLLARSVVLPLDVFRFRKLTAE